MKTRKLLAVVLAVAMLASFISVPVFADGHEGGILEDLGILVGTDEDGVTEDYLASTATRAQAALIHLRLFGLEAAALAFEGTETFLDAADATEFWQPVLEYLKANPELGWQGSEGNFMPTAAVTGQQFTKVLLVALGYVEGTDFTYDETMTFAAGIGLDALADMAADDLTMEDVAVALVQALGLETTGVEEWTLASQLVAAGLIDLDAAEAAGFVITDPVFKVVSAEATGVKEVTVTMTTDIPEGTTVTLKKGTIGIVTTKAFDGDTVVLTGLYNFNPGTYTVTVGEAVSAPFAIAAQTATELTIGAETIFDEAGQDLMVKLADQYGDAMNMSGRVNASVFNQTNGYVYTQAVTTTIKIDPTEGGGESGDTVYVFVYDPTSTLQATATVLVIDAPYLADISIVGYEWNVGTETAARFYVGDTTAVLDVECVDQYGDEYILTDADIDDGMSYVDLVQVLVSNPSVLGVSLTPNADGDLVITGAGAGTAIVTLILPEMSIIEQSEMITVYAVPVLDSLMVVGPTETAYANEGTDFGLVGYDQYDEEFDFDGGDPISFTVNNSLVITSGGFAITDTNEVTMTPHGDGTATVFVFLGGELQGQADITVNPEAYPFAITAVDAPEAMETGVMAYIMSDDLTVIDQYGREMTNPWYDTWNWELDGVTDDGHVVDGWSGDYYVDTTTSAGVDTFVAYLTMSGAAMEESGFQFDVRNVDPNEIDGLAIADIAGPMYLGPEYAAWDADADDYWKTFSITGTVDGLSVVLLDDDSDGVPDIVDLVTSTNDNVQVSGKWLVPAMPLTGNAAGTTTVKVWRNGVVEAMTDLALSIATPDLATITPSTTAGLAPDFTAMFTYKDQYGVVMSGMMVVHADSPDGLVSLGYTYEMVDVIDGDADGAFDDVLYSVVKWDGSIVATYKVLNDVPDWPHGD